MVPGAARLGEPSGAPPTVPALDAAGERVGLVFLNSDFTDATGYSGKPIHIAVGMDAEGRIAGLQLVAHDEPIVLIGIPEARVVEAMDSLVGLDVPAVRAGRLDIPQVDVISGATVTVLVMGDSVIRSATQMLRGDRLAAPKRMAEAAPRARRRLRRAGAAEARSWEALVGDGSVRRLSPDVGDVDDAFVRSGDAAAAARPEPGAPEETFIDLYAGLAKIPAVGRSLLGERGFERLVERLEPGEHAIVVAGRGRYSFKGSGYVRGGIFDRIQLIQGVDTLRFRDRDHRRLGEVAAEGAPDFDEASLFVVPAAFGLDPAEPWRLQRLVQRPVGPLEKAFVDFDLGYATPERHLAPPPEPQPLAAAPAAEGESEALAGRLAEPLWARMWRENTSSIAIAGRAIGVLTLIFRFQDALVKRWRLYVRVRRGFLAFTLISIGWIANAQLSAVNVPTFADALITEFSWAHFLAAPLIFVFWCSVAGALLFRGRGPFCGRLCPFGALQALLNNAAQALRAPQIRIPLGLDERLRPIKYIVFVGLIGLSLHSLSAAETAAEVEPFKTAITLKFMRERPFVLYAGGILFVGLSVERFVCRYLCPLGGALAIPARIAMNFGWLKRHPQCGSPCRRCAKECPVQCIHPDGHVHPNECIWRLHCQDLHWDDHRCPAMIQKRLKRERFEAMSSPAMRGKGPAPPQLVGEREAHRDRADAHDPGRRDGP